ncbi:TMP repeat-containing protein [Marininema mesophilum]|uniref:TMP repeat-containing protein n=1 Tax=Marininema mesophilum TaxID=1048340 RepID=A0A1H3BSM0_9BACL|nr:hypothetical protein [Marininema mesophilum]SDX44933.1 TMP repeat-containing protein [Marininema mesophilum]
MAAISNIFVNIGARIASFERSMAQVESRLRSAGAKWQATGQAMSAAGSTMTQSVSVPLGIVMGLMTKTAIDGEEMRSKFDHIFGSMSKSMNSWADKQSDALNMSGQEIRGYTADLYGTINGMGITDKTAASMSKRFVQLAADLGSFNNVPTTEVVEAMTGAFRGEYDMLQKYVPTVSDATVKEYAYANGIAKKGAELTSAQKAQAIYGLTLKGTKKAQGDLARTQGSAANKLKDLSAKWTDLSEKLGTILIPILQRVVAKIEKLVQWFSHLSKGQQEMIVYVGLAVVALGPVIMVIGNLINICGTLIGAGSKVVSFFGKMNGVGAKVAGLGARFSAFGAKVGNAFSSVGKVLRSGFTKVIGFIGRLGPVILRVVQAFRLLSMAFLTSPIGWVVMGIAALIAIGVLLYQNWDTVKTFLVATWDAIKAAAVAVWKGIKAFFVAIWDGMKAYFKFVFNTYKTIWSGIWKGIKSAGVAIWNAIKSAAVPIWNGVKSAVTTAIKTASSILKGLWNGMKSAASSIWNSIKSAAKGAWNGIKSVISNGIRGAWSTVKNYASSFLSAGRGLLSALTRGIRSGISSAISAVKSGMNTIRSYLPFSPAKEGPLSDLDKSGESFFPTWAQGAEKGIRPMTARIASGMAMANAQLATGSTGRLIGSVQVGVGGSRAAGTAAVGGRFHIEVGQLVVREEADINKIAESLWRMQQRKESRKIGR